MKALRWVAIVLLAFLGLSSMVGGIPLILDPQGKLLGMPLSLLRYSPFDTFLIPGIVLLVANGLLAMAILVAVLLRRPGYGLLTVLQGCILLGWLVIECILIRAVAWPHCFYGVIALGLVVSGMVLYRKEIPASRPSTTRAGV